MAKRRSEVERLQDYHTVFNTVAGKRVLNDLMKTHYVLNSTFNENQSVTFFREGERNAILRILTILKLDINNIRERIEKDEKIRNDEAIV